MPTLPFAADAVADSYQDWCNRWVEVTFFTKDADVKKKYLDEDRWATFKVFEHFLSKCVGDRGSGVHKGG